MPAQIRDMPAAPASLDEVGPERIVIFRTQVCPYCVAAARYLREVKKVDVVEVDLTTRYDDRDLLSEWTGQRTVPQIFIGDTWVGGYDDMRSLERAGGLDPLLERTRATS
jgi:glutaredoxin 3